MNLITGAMKRLATNKSMGRAEAMRQSMLAMIDAGGPEAHPAFGRLSSLSAKAAPQGSRIGLAEVGEDSINIPKPTSRAWDCGNSGMTAPDP